MLRREHILLWPLVFTSGHVIGQSLLGVGDGDWGDTCGGGDGDGDYGNAVGSGHSWPYSGNYKRGAVQDFGCGFGNAADGDGRSRKC